MTVRILVSGAVMVAVGMGCGAGAEEASVDPEPQQVWWDRVQELCGQAFPGELIRYDPELDTGWLDRDVVMHVRECSDDEIRIPLHVGDDRSRTWVLTRTENGLRLKHDHRHEDGTEDASTWYGGDATEPGAGSRQAFPADEYSLDLFLEQDHPAGVENVWIMEVHPGSHFVYNLTRPDRDFAARFDLTNPVEPPPAPWGAAEG